MINKKLDDISLPDINGLTENNIQEHKTLEYKSSLPGSAYEDKKEFLADVSSLANTEGGDLIYGISEKNGILQKEIGMDVQDMGAEIARLQNLIRDGIFPRINVEAKTIEANGKSLLILRIKPSTESPHRVTLQGHDKFYRRNTNGKYAMDVVELRNSFLQSGEITQKIKMFRMSRIADIKAGDVPVPIVGSDAFLAIHIVPLSSFTTFFKLDSTALSGLRGGNYNSLFRPLNSSGWSHRINLDGVVAYTPYNGPTNRTYVQFYRDGKIEAVETSAIGTRMAMENKFLPIVPIENETIQYVDKMLKLLAGFDFQPPFYTFLSLVGVKDFTIKSRSIALEQELITQNELLLPEVVIENYSDSLSHKFRPIFDMIWNAAGLSKSPDFDDNDNFNVQN